MSNDIVALHGWNSSTRGWNEGAWNSEVALPGAAGSVGATTVTADANVSVTGVAGTASVNSASTATTGNANVTVTGVFATGEIGTLQQPWGLIIPSQTPNFSGITPTQTPSWADIAA